MQEIQVGEYVRTKNGYIGKIIDIVCGQDAYFDNREMFLGFNMGAIMYSMNGIDIHSITFEENVKKHSFNIIDLIEKDDYVNGKKVINIWEEPFGVFAGMILMQLEDEDVIPNMREIKSIVTHEQFDSVKYEVE